MKNQTLPTTTPRGPKRFSDLVGIDHLMSTIRRMVESRNYHGVLIVGESGTGKTPLANLLYARAHCDRPDDLDPCGMCDACTTVLEGGGNDGVKCYGYQLSSNDYEYLKFHLRGMPMDYQRKSLYIDRLESTPNSLLVRLPEIMDKHPQAPIIMTAATIDSLPEPLVSRCRILHLNQFTTETMASWTAKVANAAGLATPDDHALHTLIEAAGLIPGRILKAIELLAGEADSLTMESLESPIVQANLAPSTIAEPLLTMSTLGPEQAALEDGGPLRMLEQ
ncbi:MAG: hypothetical protein IH971_10045 [Candidatus Marinimicrobia bacterium]|nr:hypothetical protein [Candidatus Neomarinimicrobiota bacterium]